MDLTPRPSQDQERSEKQRPGCPECAPGAASPHTEPDLPHIHLTSYGYLIYAPDHDHRDFIEEIRAFERRAGREDAARDLEGAYGKAKSYHYRAALKKAIGLARGGQHPRTPREDVTP